MSDTKERQFHTAYQKSLVSTAGLGGYSKRGHALNQWPMRGGKAPFRAVEQEKRSRKGVSRQQGNKTSRHFNNDVATLLCLFKVVWGTNTNTECF